MHEEAGLKNGPAHRATGGPSLAERMSEHSPGYRYIDMSGIGASVKVGAV